MPRTLEYLETQGCPVVGYKCKNFPSFFTSEYQKINSNNSVIKLPL